MTWQTVHSIAHKIVGSLGTNNNTNTTLVFEEIVPEAFPYQRLFVCLFIF